MIRRIALVLVLLSGCVDTTPDAWCEDHPEICQTSLTTVFPAEGPSTGGTEVMLTGVAFEADTEVLFNGKPLAISSREGRTLLRGRTPSNPVGPVDIRLRNANGEVVVSGKFTYRSPTSIGAVSPSRGGKRGGTRITVTGENIHPGTRLFVGTAEATSVSIAPDGRSISGLTPPGTTVLPVPVRLEGPGGIRSLPDAFTYDPWERVDFVGTHRGSGLQRLARSGPASVGVLYAMSASDLYRSNDNGDSWAAIHPPGGYLQDIAADPVNPARVMVTSDRGLFWSWDAGATWQPALMGNEPLYAYAVTIRDDGVVFAAGYQTLHRSLDGGRTFQFLSSTPLYFERISVHGVNPDVIIGHGWGGYAISHDGGVNWPYSVQESSRFLFVAPGAGAGEVWLARYPDAGSYYTVERSVDYGASFHPPPVAPPDGYWQTFAVQSASGQIAMADYDRVYVLTVGGLAWTPLGVEPARIRALGFDLSGNILATDHATGPRIWTGTAWAARRTGMTSPQVMSVALDTTTTPRTLYVGMGDGQVMRSVNDGGSWDALPLLPNPYETRAVVSTSGGSSRTLYASQYGAIYRWVPGDAVWTAESSADAYGNLLQEPLQRDVLYTWTPSSFRRKQPNGVWEDFAQGLPTTAEGWEYDQPATHANAGLVTVYVIASRRDVEARLYARGPGDLSWRQVGDTIPLDARTWIISMGVTATHVVMSVNTPTATQLWRLAQTGGSWSQLPPEGSPGWVGRFVTDPSNRARIYALTDPLYVSGDNGATWTPLPQAYRGGSPAGAAIDPASPTDIFLALESAGLRVTYSAGE